MARRKRHGRQAGRLRAVFPVGCHLHITTLDVDPGVASGGRDAVIERFVNRPHVSDAFPGFIGMIVVADSRLPNRVVQVSAWESEQAKRDWLKGHADHPTGVTPSSHTTGTVVAL